MDKKEKIKKLLEMQKKFIELDRVGVEPEEYFAPKEGSSLSNFRKDYRDTAMEVVDLAHKEKGSKK